MSDDPLTVACRHLANSQKIIEAKNAEIERLKLTDKERGAIEEMLHLIETKHEDYGREAHYLRNLLERTKDNDHE
jgi:hypothetical protein